MRIDSGRTGLVALAIVAGLSTACEKPAPVAPPPTEVYVTEVVQRDVPVYLELVGQTQGFQDVDIRARVEGFLEAVNFREGTVVRKGDPSTKSIASRSKPSWRRRRPNWPRPRRSSKKRRTTSRAIHRWRRNRP